MASRERLPPYRGRKSAGWIYILAGVTRRQRRGSRRTRRKTGITRTALVPRFPMHGAKDIAPLREPGADVEMADRK